MLDQNQIGLELQTHTVEVEKGRLKFFARATGQRDPIYLDEVAAQSAGYRSLPAPPTFLFSLEMDQADPFYFLKILKINIERLLHGEQTFIYHEPICAGDSITLKTRIADIYSKKNGALEFVALVTKATNQNELCVAEMTRLLVVRN